MEFFNNYLAGFGMQVGEATTCAHKSPGLETQPKSWPTWWTFRVNCCLETMFLKFTSVNHLLKGRSHITSATNC